MLIIIIIIMIIILYSGHNELHHKKINKKRVKKDKQLNTESIMHTSSSSFRQIGKENNQTLFHVSQTQNDVVLRLC